MRIIKHFKECPNCKTKNPKIEERYTLRGMTLVDLLEMICDWKAATMRHIDGDIYKSLVDNKKRFGISDDLYEILLNTVKMIEGE